MLSLKELGRSLAFGDLEVTGSYTDEEGTATFELSELSTDERMGVRLTTTIQRKSDFTTLSRGDLTRAYDNVARLWVLHDSRK